MKQKIGIALVKFSPEDKKAWMFEFPADEWFNVGEVVLVEDKDGHEKRATVVDSERFSFEYESNRDEYNRLMMVAGIDEPSKRIIARVKDIKYKEEEVENED
jgi:hypothetical protein